MESRKFFIGGRVLKTVLAVIICFTISSFLRTGIPFYSAIAAILCMQVDYQQGYVTGKNRFIGTLIGGFYAYLLIELAKFLGLEILGYPYFLLVSLFLIPVIYTNVNVKFPASSYISCVVFLSIVVAHGNDVSPLIFAINRVIDTAIGIGVSIGVNYIF